MKVGINLPTLKRVGFIRAITIMNRTNVKLVQVIAVGKRLSVKLR